MMQTGIKYMNSLSPIPVFGVYLKTGDLRKSVNSSQAMLMLHRQYGNQESAE